MGYWRTVGSRAWRETLEQIRWDSPVRVMTSIAAPIISGAIVWYATGNPAWAGIVTVMIVALIGLCVFACKIVTVPAILAFEQNAEITKLTDQRAAADALRQTRLEVARLLTNAETLKRSCEVAEPMSEEFIEIWYQDCHAVIGGGFDEDTWHSFNSDVNTAVVTIENVPERNRQLWTWLNKRAVRLDGIYQSMPKPGYPA